MIDGNFEGCVVSQEKEVAWGKEKMIIWRDKEIEKSEYNGNLRGDNFSWKSFEPFYEDK